MVCMLCMHQARAQRFWVAAGASNWNNTANWSTTSGGPGGASVPGAGDAVTFNALGLGNCTLDVAPTVAGLTINGYTSTIDLSGFTLTTTGTITFATGTITNSGGAASVALNTTGTTTFSGTQFDADVTGSSGVVHLNGSVFNNPLSINKTNSSNDNSTGSNTFNSTATFQNSSTGQFRLATTSPDIYNGDVSFVIGNTGSIYPAYTAVGSQFNGNISITYNSTGSVIFGNTGTSTLASTKTISVAGFGGGGCGNLTLSGFTQSGTTAQTITLAGNNTATLTLGPASSFGGTLVATTPSIIFNSSTFKDLTVTKTGTQSDDSRGGNTFDGVMTINDAGGNIQLGTNSADAGDVWNADAFFNVTGGYRIRVGEETSGNIFNANATFTNTSASDVNSRIQVSRLAGSSTTFNGTTTFINNGNASDIHISYDAGTTTTFNGPVVFASDATNTSEFYVAYNGDVIFNNNVTITSTTGGVLFGVNNGTVSMSAGNTMAIGGGGFSAGELRLKNFTQAGTAPMTLELTGSSILRIGGNSAIGGDAGFKAPQLYLNGCTFSGVATLEKTGATDNASVGGNIFSAITTITNSGSGYLLLGNGTRDQFLGATTFNNTGTYRIFIAYNHSGQTTTFASGLTLNSNKSGGTDGWSYFIGDNNSSNVSITGDLTINCGGSVQSNYRFLNGGGTMSVDGTTTINLTNTNSTSINMGTVGTTSYNGNIVVMNTGGTGIYFNTTASASSTLAPTRTISVSNFGFSVGQLSLARFTQTGTTAQTLTLTGTAVLTIGPTSQFDGNVDFKSPQLYLNGCTYNGFAILEKTGATNNASTGGNTFNNITTITNSGSDYLLTGNVSPDVFNAATTINNSGSDYIYLAYNTAGNQFNGDITLNNTGSALGINFSNNSIASTTFTGGTLTVGGSGFSTGELALRRFTQVGNIAQNMVLTGTASMVIGPTSQFDGDVNFKSPELYLNGCTFNRTTLEKTGSSNNNSAGGNIFNGITTITNSGSGQFLMGNGTRDQFLSAAIFNNTGSNRIYLAYNHPGQTTTFAFLTLNSNKSGGTDAWSYLVAESSNTSISVAGNLTINCAGTIRSDHRFLNGSGSSMSVNGPTTIANYNTNASTTITMGVNGSASYNGDIVVENTTSTTGIYFNSTASASSTLAATKTITIGGFGFNTGHLTLARFLQVGATPQSLTLTGTAILTVGPDSQFDGNINFKSPQLFLNGCTYNGTASLEKTGAIDDASNGGNIFNGTTTISNSGTDYLLTANANPDIFNAALTINNSSSDYIYLAHNVAGNQFNGDITVNNTGSALGIRFANNAGGAATFTGGTIAVGGTGFDFGELGLRRFTQVGNIAQNLTLTGSALLTVGPTSQFDGDVTFTAPRVLLNGCTYNRTARLEKTSAIGDDGTGGNIFNGETTLVNSGSAYFRTAYTTADIFNAKLILTNTGASSIRVADNAPGNQFNDNIELNSTFGGGIYFGNSAAGTSTLAAGKTISVGTSGFITGDIRLYRFTQVGATPQTLDLGGIAILTLGPNSTFDGNVNFRSPQIYLNGTTFNGTAYLEKKGATNNASSGGNTFNGTTELVNSGSDYLLMANTTADIFNGSLTVTNTGSDNIHLAYASGGNQFNGNLTFNSTLGSGGIYFSNTGSGSSTIATGVTMTVGGLGFSSGELSLRRLTQTGSANQTLVLTGSALLRIGPNTTFNGILDFKAPRIALDGATYNGTTSIEKTGASNDDSSGGNTFNGLTTLANSGSGYFRNGVSSLDDFNNDLTLTNTGTATIRMADVVAGTTFNGNLILNSTNTTAGTGIFFCNGSAAATATLAIGKTISVGLTGFSAGELRISRFTQLGATPQTLTLTSNATLTTGPSVVWNGDFTASSPNVYLNGNTFNGAAISITKTGTSTNNSVGGNTFGGTTTIVNTGTGIFRLGVTSADDFVGDVTFNQQSGTIQPAYNIASTFNGNITVDGPSSITFGFNTGTLTFSGASNQTVNKSGAASPIFRRLLMNKSANGVTLNTDVSVTTNATFTSGILYTTAANFINFANGSSSTGGSNASHVDGPVRKTGNAAFTFPTGDNGIFRTIAISAPSNAAHYFTAEYFKAMHPFGGPSTYAPGILTLSGCEYWILDRNPVVGGSNVNVTLSWNSPDCTGAYITDLATLKVARWNGTQWVDQGNGGTTGTVTSGTVITSAPVTSFSPFTIASSSLVNPLPIELIEFSAQAVDHEVHLSWATASELRNDYFEIQRSIDALEFVSIGKVDGMGTTNKTNQYRFIDATPIIGKGYYRLKQTDFDGQSSLSEVISIDLNNLPLKLYPNPAQREEEVTLSKSGDFEVNDNLGRVVLRLYNTNKINVGSLAPGLYTVRSEQGEVIRLVVR